MRRHVLILGATGVFGQRLAWHLARFENLRLVLAARGLERAETLAAELRRDGCAAQGISLDRNNNLAAQLAALRPWVVVDCTGPFQEADFTAAKAALSAGAHYIDLADAGDYLRSGPSELDALARQAGCGAYLGASTTPALSYAVAEHLSKGLAAVERIDIAITPGGRGEVGPAVIAAVLSYAGRPVPVWRQGRLQTALGWSDPRDIWIDGLGKRRVAMVETYDAELLGQRLNVRDTVAFRAGLEAWPEQSGVEAIAWLRAKGWLGSCKALVRPLVRLRALTKWLGSDQGGMLVAMTGRDAAGHMQTRQWRLIARHGDGPNVPVMAAAAMIARLQAGRAPDGAVLAADVLSLEEIEAQMQGYAIETMVENGPGLTAGQPVPAKPRVSLRRARMKKNNPKSVRTNAARNGAPGSRTGVPSAVNSAKIEVMTSGEKIIAKAATEVNIPCNSP
ncbi:MAG: saccharopine dehydrogenase NADP-binding domain-containing protein [Pseudomonadota bacterium]